MAELGARRRWSEGVRFRFPVLATACYLAAMKTGHYRYVLVLGLLLQLGCGVHVMRSGRKYPPRPDPAKILWKEYVGQHLDFRKLELLGQVSKRTFWCGVTRARLDEDNHAALAAEAGRLGGDIVVLYCGELGTVSECHCYGQVMRRIDGAAVDPDLTRSTATTSQAAVESSSRVCIPGQSQLCYGPGACKGGQACLPDGSGFSPCDCGNGQ